MRILITGFDPFGGEEINPALEAVKQLPDNIEGHTIDKFDVHPKSWTKNLTYGVHFYYG